MGDDSERLRVDVNGAMKRDSTHWEKLEAARALAPEGGSVDNGRDHFIFWLGGVSVRKDPDALVLLDLVLAGDITPAEAVSEEPVRWIQMITDLQTADGIVETPSTAVKKWRELTPTAQRLVVDQFESARQERIAKGFRTEPTTGDLERLKKANKALALGEPQSNLEVLRQIAIIHTGIVALQSTDDLGSDWANRRALQNLKTLIAKYDRLNMRAAKI